MLASAGALRPFCLALSEKCSGACEKKLLYDFLEPEQWLEFFLSVAEAYNVILRLFCLRPIQQYGGACLRTKQACQFCFSVHRIKHSSSSCVHETSCANRSSGPCGNETKLSILPSRRKK